MADISFSTKSSYKNIHGKKLFPRVDLTPMVDLGFLLITFFMLTTTLTKPKTMNLFLPADGRPTLVPASKSLTILIDKSGVYYYNGEADDAAHLPELIKSNYGERAGIGEVIRRKQQQVAQAYHNPGETIVLIKPTNEASYQNVVNILDEMNINHVTKYALVNISAREKQWIDQRME